MGDILNTIFQEESALTGAVVGVSVRSAETGELLYDYNGKTRLKPASNLKLFTAAAALSVLGKDHTFQTEILTDGKMKWKVLNGNLYIKGKGDPALTYQDIVALAKGVKDAGVKVIRGDIVADDTWYDDVRYSIDVPWSDETYDYAAQISALSLSPMKDSETACIIVESLPGERVDDKAVVKVFPAMADVRIVNETVTVTEESEHDKELEITRKHGTNTIVVDGEVPINSENKKEIVPVWEPQELAGKMFYEALKDQGVIVLGDLTFHEAPDNVTEIVGKKSSPLSELIIPFMKQSINSYGEVLAKEMGRQVHGEGSWKKGLDVVGDALSEWDISIDELVIRDGSGISHVNAIPANEVTKLLYEVQHEDWFQAFFDSLPVAGAADKKDAGTLKNRLKQKQLEGKVWAKTGTLSTVSSLSGYVETANGERLIFSILINNVLDEFDGKKIKDRFIYTLVQGAMTH